MQPFLENLAQEGKTLKDWCEENRNIVDFFDARRAEDSRRHAIHREKLLRLLQSERKHGVCWRKYARDAKSTFISLRDELRDLRVELEVKNILLGETTLVHRRTLEVLDALEK